MSSPATASDPVVSATPQMASKKRDPGLDAVRFLAAALIVWLHAMEISPHLTKLAVIGRGSVPFFAMAAVLLMGQSLRRDPARPYGAYAWSRVVRIYGPFLVWTILYLLFRNAKYIISGHTGDVQINPGLLLGSAAHHLWFLPFLLIVCLVMFPIVRIIVRGGPTARLVAALCAVAGLAIAFINIPWSTAPAVEQQRVTAWEGTLGAASYLGGLGWWALPAVFWGAALVAVDTQVIKWLARWRRLAFASAVLAILGCVTALLLLGRFSFLENIYGVAFLAAALLPWKGRIVDFLAYLGRYAYGIYLIHVAVGLGMEMFVVRDRNSASFPVIFGLMLATLVISTLLAVLIGRFRATRWLAP